MRTIKNNERTNSSSVRVIGPGENIKSPTVLVPPLENVNIVPAARMTPGGLGEKSPLRMNVPFLNRRANKTNLLKSVFAVTLFIMQSF